MASRDAHVPFEVLCAGIFSSPVEVYIVQGLRKFSTRRVDF